MLRRRKPCTLLTFREWFISIKFIITYFLERASLVNNPLKSKLVYIIFKNLVGFEVLTAVSMKIAVFWVVVNFYQTTRCYNPEDSNL
jgi:hypothetical protein